MFSGWKRIFNRTSVKSLWQANLVSLNADRISERLVAIDSLESIAKENRHHRQQIMKILAEFIRDRASTSQHQSISGVGDDIQAALTTIGRINDLNQPEIIDLSHVNLAGANLDFGNFARVNFYQSNFTGASLRQTNLEVAILSAANFQNANLESAQLIRANLGAANLQKANLQKANLTQANLYLAKLDYTDLRGAILTEANLNCVENKSDLTAIY